jgi:hypothetical protein
MSHTQSHVKNDNTLPQALQSKYACHRSRNTHSHILNDLLTAERSSTCALCARGSRSTHATRTHTSRLAQYLVDDALRLCIVSIKVRLKIARQSRVPGRCRREGLKRANLCDFGGDAVARGRRRDKVCESGLRGHGGA